MKIHLFEAHRIPGSNIWLCHSDLRHRDVNCLFPQTMTISYALLLLGIFFCIGVACIADAKMKRR
jgi:hypothetical protein